jgi:hypothetical protein
MRERCLGCCVEVLSKEGIMANKAAKTIRQRPGAKESAIVKPVLKTGLPPGISPERAKDPGNAPGSSKRVKNNS